MASAAPASVFVGTSPVVAQVASTDEAPTSSAYTAPFAYAAAPYTYAAAAPYAYTGAPAPFTYAAGYAAAPFAAYNAAYTVS